MYQMIGKRNCRRKILKKAETMDREYFKHYDEFRVEVLKEIMFKEAEYINSITTENATTKIVVMILDKYNLLFN